MTDPIPEEARQRAEEVLRPLLETLARMDLPTGSNTAIVLRVPEEID